MGKFGKCCCGCCIKESELPTSITIDGVSITGDWEQISECCWKLTSSESVVIPGFNEYDICERLHERTSKYTCWYRSYFYDFLAVPLYTSGPIGSVSADTLRTVKTEYTFKQEGVIRMVSTASKIAVYVSKVNEDCSGEKKCRWSIGVAVVGTEGYVRIVKQYVSIDTVSTETYRNPVLDLSDYSGVPCPTDDRATGTKHVDADVDTCDINLGVGNPAHPSRSRFFDDRPDSFTLAADQVVACGDGSCMPAGDDGWTFTLDCSAIPTGNICSFEDSEPTPPSTVIARQLHPSNGKHMYLRSPAFALYINSQFNNIPIGQPMPDCPATDCSIDCVPRYITKDTKDYVFSDLGFMNVQPQTWHDDEVVISEECDSFVSYTLELPTIEVELEWPGS